MFSSWKIAKIFGIDLKIHWSFWLLPLWVVLSREDADEPWSLLLHLSLIAALFSCVVLHELGHALTARRFGIGTRSITLSPLGGVAQLERMSHKPWEEFCIAVAGPLVNVAIAFLLGSGLLAFHLLDPLVTENGGWLFASLLLLLNVVMVLFNMLPAFPMDGGRVLRAILSSWLGQLKATRAAVAIGTVTATLMGFAGVYWFGNPWVILIALFVVWAGSRELRVLEIQQRQGGDASEETLTPAMQFPSVSLPRPALHVTIRIWDPLRNEWVPRTY